MNDIIGSEPIVNYWSDKFDTVDKSDTCNRANFNLSISMFSESYFKQFWKEINRAERFCCYKICAEHKTIQTSQNNITRLKHFTILSMNFNEMIFWNLQKYFCRN